jgi:hypothetical protein
VPRYRGYDDGSSSSENRPCTLTIIDVVRESDAVGIVIARIGSRTAMSVDRFPRGRSAIVGAATFGIGESPGMSSLHVAASPARLALADANLNLGDLDALFVCLPDDALAGLSAAENLGIRLRFRENNRTSGSAFHSHR